MNTASNSDGDGFADLMVVIAAVGIAIGLAAFVAAGFAR